jgi:MOSC domain-containing protein YiiM
LRHDVQVVTLDAVSSADGPEPLRLLRIGAGLCAGQQIRPLGSAESGHRDRRVAGENAGYTAEVRMRIVSLNVGLPREMEWRGRTVRTSIFKTPADRRLRVTTLNLDGDQQSDLSVHGGVDKAVYAYPSEHYAYWRQELPQMDLPRGVFGENLTTEGLLEEDVRIGDRFRVGSAEFVVTQPRMPCFKLGIRFGRPDIVKRFLRSGRSGFYFAVLLEGEVGAGDSIELIAQAEGGLTVADVVNLYTTDAENQELLRRATQVAALPESWRDYFRKRLWEPDV